MSAARTLGRRLRAEDGMTIIELMVAVMLITVGLIAVLGTVDTASKTVVFSQRHEEALSYAQREVEKLGARDYADLELSATVAHTTDGNPAGDTSVNPTDPRYYIHPTASPAGLEIRTNYHNNTSGLVAGTPANGEPLVVDTETVNDPVGAINPGPEAFSTGTVTGNVYRFITYRDENCAGTVCDGTENSKRVTVAVVLNRGNDGTGPTKPIYVSTLATDPDAGAPGSEAPPDTNPGSGTPISAQPFFLTDTTCNNTARQAIAGAHATHDTGAATAGCAAAPYHDLMPPDLPTLTDDVPDLSNELVRASPRGLALMRHAATCPNNYPAVDGPTRKGTLHTWATPPFASAFSTPASNARSVLSFWTNTVEGATGAVTLCVKLRKRAANGTVTAIPNGADTADVTYSLPEWPRTPTQLGVSIDHDAFSMAVNDRLLLTLSVQSSSGADIELLYDDPSYKSLLSVLTTTPIN